MRVPGKHGAVEEEPEAAKAEEQTRPTCQRGRDPF